MASYTVHMSNPAFGSYDVQIEASTLRGAKVQALRSLRSAGHDWTARIIDAQGETVAACSDGDRRWTEAQP